MYTDEVIAYIKRTQPEIYTNTEYVGRYGTAYVKLYIVYKGKIRNITHIVAELSGGKIDKNHYGLKYGGFGYSKPFQAVYNFARALWPNGYKCTGENCHSNDHANGDNAREKGKHLHQDGGYFFGQENQL